MIPLKLTLSGIYSFRENKQTIDFKRLTQESLFGIFGKVGSGKSTILEAIIFALYSKTERMGGRDYLYNMMNLSSNESYIDFEFEAGEVEYRSIVKLKRNSKNFENVTTPKRELYKKENGEWVTLDYFGKPLYWERFSPFYLFCLPQCPLAHTLGNLSLKSHQ